MFSIAGKMERRGNSQYDRIYKFRGLLPETDDKVDDLFLETLGETLDYIAHMKIDIPESAFTGKSFHRKRKDSEINCIGLRYRHLWAASINCQWLEEPHTCRRIIHDIALTETSMGLELGYQVTAECVLGQPIDFSPDFIFRITDRIGLYQNSGPVLDGLPIIIQDESQIDELLEIVSDPERNLPVVVISELNAASWRNAPNAPKLILNPHDLARHLRGFALVVQLSPEASREWGLRAGRMFSVYDGAIRTFYPSRDFINSSGKDHPTFFKDNIPSYQFGNQKGARGYFAFLVNRLRQYSVTAKIPWSGLYFLPEAVQLQKEIELYASTIPKTPPLKGNARTIAQLQKKLAITQEELKKKDIKISELDESLLEREIETGDLKAQLESLSDCQPLKASAPPAVLSANEASAIVGYANMADRCRAEFAGKLLLLKRAEHTLSKAQYESPTLVFQALEMLAGEFRDSRMGKADHSAFLEKCHELGVTFTETRKKASSRSDDIFTINYPQGTQSVEMLRYQLCKGNSKKRRYRMRIYFFWSERDNLVVVGDLPQQIGD